MNDLHRVGNPEVGMPGEVVTLLDLDAVFDPDRQPGTHIKSQRVIESCVVKQCDLTSTTNLPIEWHWEWEERAAILEFDGELPREQAEHLALLDILKRMRSGEIVT